MIFFVLLGSFAFITGVQAINSSSADVTDKIFFDVDIDGEDAGRIVIGLFGDIAPKTVKNFVTLATTGHDGNTYKGTAFHRVIKDFMIQGGDLAARDGSGSISIYGPKFDDENFKINHWKAGLISMANAGKNTNGCQFFITTTTTSWLNGRHTVFGSVIDGMDVVRKIEDLQVDSDDHPKKSVIIKESGSLPMDPITLKIDVELED
uniref:Peptidyl-prolyl cis-trans isomerase n=1 Tax=Strigamia maritima TaxID=126957 RepID=T1J488_STRMM